VTLLIGGRQKIESFLIFPFLMKVQFVADRKETSKSTKIIERKFHVRVALFMHEEG
jgi:hypothetical protein